MASFTLVTSLPKFGHAGATIARARAWNPRVFAVATPRLIQVPKSHNQEGSVTADGIKQGASEIVNNSLSEPLQDKAYSSAPEQVANKTQDMAGQVSVKGQNMSERAKQTMQETWDSANNKTQDMAGQVSAQGQNISEKAKQTMQEAWDSTNNKTQDVAGQVSAKAQNITERAKQTMQEAWDSTKNTANKAADTVMGKAQESTDSMMGKAQESADSVKESAETVRKNMNRKNN